MTGLSTRSVKRLTAGVLLASAVSVAQAVSAPPPTTYDISLTGVVEDFIYHSFSDAGIQYEQGELYLTLNSAAFTPSVGDTINATISLNKPFTIPASVSYTSFLFGLWGSSFPTGDTQTSGTTAFLNSATSGGMSASGGASSSGWLPNGIVLSSPNNGAITFDAIESSLSIIAIPASAELSYAKMYYTLAAPVPEADSYLMMLAGLGVVGLVARRRVKKDIAIAA